MSTFNKEFNKILKKHYISQSSFYVVASRASGVHNRYSLSSMMCKEELPKYINEVAFKNSWEINDLEDDTCIQILKVVDYNIEDNKRYTVNLDCD